MTPEQFVFWLNGALEIMDPNQLNEKQIQIIKDHIALVLKKETPVRHELVIKEDLSMQPGEVKFVPQTHALPECPSCKKSTLLCSCISRSPLIC